MAVTVTAVSQPSGQSAPKNRLQFTVTATADADTTATVTHNFGLAADQQAWLDVQLIPTLTAAGLSLWYVSAFGANSITLTKSTATSSGNASAQLNVVVRKPHSLVG